MSAPAPLAEGRTLLDVLVRYRQVLYLGFGGLMAFGVIALFVMPRDEWPQFDVPVGTVIAVYPGASSEQIEQQVTTEVERYLYQYKSVDRAKTYSISRENVMVIYVHLSEEEKNQDAFWTKLRHGLNELKPRLPAGVRSLTADNDYGNTSALLLAVSSSTRSSRELETWVRALEADVRRVPSVSRVRQYGVEHEQIGVHVDDARLAQYGIKPVQLLAALKPQSAIDYAGEVDDGRVVRPVHVLPAFASERDIAEQIVHADPMHNVLRVRDVARVVREYPDATSHLRVNGTRCIIVSLEMVPGNNVVQFGRDVGVAIESFEQSLPPDVAVHTISNIPDAVSHAINNFLKEFAIAILAVILVTLLLLPMRVARIAALSIPASISIAIGLMWVSGMDLQTVSLAGLIIVLGITVDDAVVIIDNYIEKLDTGMTPWEAGSRSVYELFASVVSATLIIIVCFLPVPFFLKGVAGDFVRSLPLTISYALLVSLVISVTLIPLLNYKYIKTGVRAGDAGQRTNGTLTLLQRWYDRLIEAAFRHKRRVVAVGAASVVLGAAILLMIPQQSFPKIERNQFAVEVSLPQGASLAQTDTVMRALEQRLRADERIRVVTSFVGTSSPRFHTMYAPAFPSRNYGQMVVLTESADMTPEVLDDYSTRLRGVWPNVDIKWKQLAMAVAQSPIEVRVTGDSLAQLKRTAAEVAAILRTTPGTEYVRTDNRQPTPSIDVALHRDEAARLGISNTLLAYSLLVGTSGLPVATVHEGDRSLDVVLRIDRAHTPSPADIADQYVTSPLLAASVPVRTIASVQPGWTEAEIAHRNGVRSITVSAEVERGVYSSQVFAAMRPRVDALVLPPGVTISHAGDDLDSKDYITPFYYSLAVSVFIIFLILMIQFRKIATSLLIMTTLPLTLFGAAVGMLVTGYPFGVTAFIGLVGLMGVVVRNGIIYVSYAEALRREHGHTIEEAAISAGKRRMRPIFLTSAAAAVGVVPMILSGSSLWGPVGAVVCFGLLFALVLSLLVLPVLYYYFHRGDAVAATEVPA
jgi:multidrug efflux pump subunit AcrB